MGKGKIKVAVVMAWFAPYRLPLFRELAKNKNIDLVVIYCAPVETGRQWQLPDDLPYRYSVLQSRTLLRYRYRNFFGESNRIGYPAGLFTTLSEHRPDIIVAYEFRLECILAALYAMWRRSTYITWSDVTAAHDQRMGSIRMLIRRLLLRRSKVVIGSSSATLSHFQSTFKFPARKIFLSILSAHIDDFIAHFSPPPLPDSGSGVRFLFIGRLIYLKGLDVLIKAFATVRQQHPDVMLTLIGDGPEQKSLADLAERLGCADKVCFKTSIKHSELAREIVRHDVFVMPTRLDVFGLVIAEAVACGLPVICSTHAGAAYDLVKKNGLIIPPDDIAAWSRAMTLMAGDTALRQQMSHACQAVLTEHNLTSAVDGFISALQCAHT